MKLNSFTLAGLIFVLLFGGIGFSSAMNWWQTETTKVPVKYTSGAEAGEYNPADIRGSYTFGEVSELFDIPLPILQSAFRIPLDRDPAAYQLKSLEEQYAGLPVEMGTGSVRMFVAFYKGLPYELSAEEDTFLFPEAADILKSQNQMLPEQAEYLDGHIVADAPAETPAEEPAVGPVEEGAPLATQPAAEAPTPAPTEHSQPAQTLTGKTTFQDLLDWGVPQAAIEEILGGTMPAAQTVIKDYLSQQGVEFSTLKTRFQAEVDKYQ